MQGVVKVYDPATGYGVVVTNDGLDVYLRPGALDGSIFRTLRQGQRIVFSVTAEDDKNYAHTVRIGSDGY